MDFKLNQKEKFSTSSKDMYFKMQITSVLFGSPGFRSESLISDLLYTTTILCELDRINFYMLQTE